ncbi:unnamed protein product [Heterosigma akashiwo]
MVFVIQQYMLPAAEHSVVHVVEGNYVRMVERVLVMAVPSTYIWLLGFYVFFHLYMNLLAELLRFGDREFYKDWWNSTSLRPTGACGTCRCTTGLCAMRTFLCNVWAVERTWRPWACSSSRRCST